MIKITELKRPDHGRNGEFARTKGNNSRKDGGIRTIIELEEGITVLNNVTKIHKILIKTIPFREQTLF